MSSNRMNYCSINTQTTSLEHPIGSATGFERCFLFEIPLPWTKKALESTQISLEIKNALAEYRENIGDLTATLLVPEAEYAVDGARLIDIQVIDGRIEKRDLIAPDGDIAAIISTIARNQLLPESTQVDDSPMRDMIVCTQGSRDACCGTFGVPIYQYFREQAMSQPNTRVWRSSHIGGHRFAPTMIDFPTGRSWGFVNKSVAGAILSQSTHPSDLRGNYRGWVGHRDDALQLLEGEILAHVGWEWNAYAQAGAVLEHDEQGRGTVVEITGTHPEGQTLTFRGEVKWGEEFSTIASCNAEPVTYIRKRLTNFQQLVAEPASSI